MRSFFRSWAVTLAVAVLLLCLVLAFVLINETLTKSGFASGEVLSFEVKGSYFFGEILGKSFVLSTKPLQQALPVLEAFSLLLPPPVQLLLRGAFK